MSTALRCGSDPAAGKTMSAVSVKSPETFFQAKANASEANHMFSPLPEMEYARRPASYSKIPGCNTVPTSPRLSKMPSGCAEVTDTGNKKAIKETTIRINYLNGRSHARFHKQGVTRHPASYPTPQTTTSRWIARVVLRLAANRPFRFRWLCRRRNGQIRHRHATQT